MNSPFAGATQSSSYRNLYLVTDVDDTIKQTHVEDKGETVINGLLGNTAFAGMAELYGAMGSSSRHFALSGGPQETADLLNSFYSANNFSFQKTLLKNSILDTAFGDTYEFKLGKLIELEAQTRKKFGFIGKRLETVMRLQNKFILIGDDTEKDPKVYEEFQKKISESR